MGYGLIQNKEGAREYYNVNLLFLPVKRFQKVIVILSEQYFLITILFIFTAKKIVKTRKKKKKKN